LSERKASLRIIEGNRETIANGPLTFTSDSQLAKFSRNYASQLADQYIEYAT